MLGLVQQLSGLLLLLYSKYSQRNRVVETTIICGIYWDLYDAWCFQNYNNEKKPPL